MTEHLTPEQFVDVLEEVPVEAEIRQHRFRFLDRRSWEESSRMALVDTQWRK
jgi:hypothetical protein